MIADYANQDQGGVATFIGLSIYVPSSHNANVDVYVDAVSLSSNGFSGANGTITFLHDQRFHAVGASGSVISSVGEADLAGNTFYVRKSKPTFTKLNAGTDPTVVLYRFLATADNAGNIDLKQLGFYFKKSGCEIEQVSLYDQNGNQVSTPVDPVNYQNSGTYTAKLIVGAINYNPDNLNPVLGASKVITVGATPKIFEVRGVVTGFNRGAGDFIEVGFVSDNNPIIVEPQPNTAPGLNLSIAEAASKGAYTIWSDRSASAHTVYTPDWTNGYLLKDMGEVQIF